MFPVATGTPNYSVTGTGQFIPQLWSGKLVVKFYAATVLADISNTEYEGEIKKFGDEVIIRTVPDITIKDYVAGQKLDYETPESPSISLKIDKGKYFGFRIDYIQKYQSDINLLDRWSDDSAQQMKIKVDTDVLGAIYADAHAKNKGTTAGAKSSSFNLGATGSPVTLTKVNILDYIVDMMSVLDEQNVPETGRFIILPAWAVGMLKKSDIKDASLTGDGVSVLRNGRVGMVDRAMIYLSNNLSSVTDGADTVYNMIFGHKSGLTFAAQMTEMESLTAESTFGKLVRGLNVYGYKVIKPESIGHFYAKKG